MKKLAARRRQNIVALLGLAALFLAVDASASAALQRTTMASGWLLLALIVGLTLYNVRKKFPFLPLGNSATWLQIHIYAGLLSGVVFGMHIQWRIPNGIFEGVLAALYVTVFLSGLCGLIISRVFARRLSARGNPVLYGRMPRLRRHIRAEVERLVVQCMAATESAAVSEFYVERLKGYFDGPRNIGSHLLLSDRPLRQLLDEMRWQDRYLNDSERETMQQITEQARRKNDLDYHYAHHVVLKYWLFTHVPLSYALLAFAVVHAVLVHAFSGVMW